MWTHLIYLYYAPIVISLGKILYKKLGNIEATNETLNEQLQTACYPREWKRIEKHNKK